MKPKITPRNAEISIEPNDLIVSKTDTKGRIIYANRTFMRIAGYSLPELLGVQHNLVRHPDTPRGVFRLLWNTIQSGQECFAYVKNMTSDGAFYWVRANVTPDIDAAGKVRGFYSVRRKPEAEALRTVLPLYEEMLGIERRAGAAEAPEISLRFLRDKLTEFGTDYDRFVLSLK